MASPRAIHQQDVGAPTPVGVYPGGAGEFGHQDLGGNVWEGCEEGEREPDKKTREAFGNQRWLKGGCWGNNKRALAAAYRLGLWLMYRLDLNGFRVVVSTSRLDP